MAEINFKVRAVWLVLSGKTEEALELLAKEYSVSVPTLKVGLPKGHKTTAWGTYNANTQTISVLNSDVLANPFVIIHEFYHHLRSRNVEHRHRGTEGNADKFAADFITQYQAAVKRFSGQ